MLSNGLYTQWRTLIDYWTLAAVELILGYIFPLSECYDMV